MNAAILLLAAAAAAGSPERFDLDCSAPIEDPKPGIISQANVHFRFDLTAGRWCEGDCGQVHDILEVQPTKIYLDKSPPELPSALLHYRFVDRMTGEYVWAGHHVFEAAMCSKLPFSGFPSFDTKF